MIEKNQKRCESCGDTKCSLHDQNVGNLNPDTGREWDHYHWYHKIIDEKGCDSYIYPNATTGSRFEPGDNHCPLSCLCPLCKHNDDCEQPCVEYVQMAKECADECDHPCKLER